MKALYRRPLLLCFVAWCFGICLAFKVRLYEFDTLLPLIFSAFALFCSFLLSVNGNNYKAKAVILLVRLIPIFFISLLLNAPFFRPIPASDVKYLPENTPITLKGYFKSVKRGAKMDSWQGEMVVISKIIGGNSTAVDDITVYCYGYKDRPEVDMTVTLSGTVSDYGAKTPLPYTFDSSMWNLLHNYDYTIVADSVTATGIEKPKATFYLTSWRDVCHNRLTTELEKREVNYIYSAIIEGLVLGGSGADIPRDVTEIFKKSGTLHVMVVSGNRISAFTALFLFPLLLFGYRGRITYPRARRWLTISSLILLAIYVIIADSGVSVTRSIITFVVFTATVLMVCFGKDVEDRSLIPDGITTLALAGFVIVFINPASLYDVGFHLSFLAVLGIITINPILFRFINILLDNRTISSILSVTVAAQIFTTPILIWHFGTLPLFGLIANLITVPITAIIFVLGLLLIVFAVFAPVFVSPILFLTLPLTELTFSFNAFFANLPFSVLNYYSRSTELYILYFVLIAAIFYALNQIPTLTIEKLSRLKG